MCFDELIDQIKFLGELQVKHPPVAKVLYDALSDGVPATTPHTAQDLNFSVA